uniref:Integrin alpha second immunoglobulin-like domain-containing protein n=1 Tax=Glossina pallidipes TaxID=7398 RepID=A0A1B0A219_GLOPL
MLMLSTLCLLLLYVVSDISLASAYNFSPKPNAVISDPQLATSLPKYESSYFGFTLNLRPSGIIVGAPRAQSTLPLQRYINETGAIYRCYLSDQTCSPYVFDDQGNRNIEYSEYTYDSEKRDFQWLGAAMDGGVKDTDKLLVCAPRFVAPAPNDYLMHGLCYWINDTLTDSPTNVRKISPLRLKQDQIKEEKGQRVYYYMLAEQGLSAHITPNDEEFLIGAPGIHTWKGSVIRYRKRTVNDDPSLSRRDTEQASRRRVPRQSEGDLPQAYYESDIPNPEKFEQPNDSYFGYSVSSGYFDSNDKEKLLYVATAPQANEQSGEAYIFDLASGGSISKSYVFRGKQFGEYFGYAVLAEDLNNDGLTDVIISAPQYSVTGSFDEGAIYVFLNQGRFNFERKLLVSPIRGKVRFGTTLTRLGDINHDGYNDIAVGAPFAGNGSVFIYLGSERGLREQTSQRLKSPLRSESIYGSHMFGHGLSKGSDIDNNGFNDLAIGAPNAETVFLYRAYPVVQIHATINSQTREIKPEQTSFPVTVCYGISTTSSRIVSQDLAVRVAVDPQVKRVKLVSTGTNELTFNASAGLQMQCRVLECDVRFSVADIFKPIELEIHYELINGIPDSEVFCEICAAVDPAEPKLYRQKIIFSTGCASEICIADLQVMSTGLDHTYILGSSRTFTVTYEIVNKGETAYLPQINITSSNRMPFAKVPSNCKASTDAVMLCDLNRGQPMAKGAKDNLKVIYDVSGISGNALILTAEVFSTGKELASSDNIVREVITLTEFTEIDAIGSPKTPHINLEKITDTAEVINIYEIKSNGPSNVGAMELKFDIPVAYRIPGATATIPIIDMSNITMQATYDSQLVGIDFYQNTTQILMNSIETFSRGHLAASVSDLDLLDRSVDLDSMKMDDNKDSTLEVLAASITSRRRRREVTAYTASKEQYARIAQFKAYDMLSDDVKGTLPVNRTIIFNCNDSETTICVRAVMHVYDFKPDKPLTVIMKYNVDLKEVNQILIEPWEFFVILIGLDVTKSNDPLGKTLAINKKIEFNIISKHQLYVTPIWVIVLAVLGGLLALALITYGMYRAGFFKRATKEEMDKLVHQAQVSGDGVNETSTLNAENLLIYIYAKKQ